MDIESGLRSYNLIYIVLICFKVYVVFDDIAVLGASRVRFGVTIIVVSCLLPFNLCLSCIKCKNGFLLVVVSSH